MFRYAISGLTLASELELSSAAPAPEDEHAADVTVACAPLPGTIGGEKHGPNWEMTADAILLAVPRVARFLIRQGREIIVDLHPEATGRDAGAFVLGTVFGILMHQRGTLTLHGAAVARGGEAIALCGRSGAGKSTLAAALCRHGCDFVTDDICAVSLDGDCRPVVPPDGRQLKLWQGAIDQLDLGGRRSVAVRPDFEKFFVAPEKMAPAAVPLVAIYILTEARPPFAEGIGPLTLPDAMRALDRDAFRPGVRARMMTKPQMMAQNAAILSRVKVFRLVRPLDFAKLEDVVRNLLTHWQGLAS
jgi:hypothetical protein